MSGDDTVTHLTKISTLLAFVALAGCSENPAEVRSSAEQFAVKQAWAATAAPVGTSTVRATLAIKQYAGFRLETSVSITGAPSAGYQWRIFRGDCAMTAVAATAAASGLFLFATIQSYPDVTMSASGSGTTTRIVAGQLDSLTKYSVRVRATQTATNWNGTSPIACGNLQRS